MTRQHTPGPWEVGYCTWNDDGNVCYELRGIRQGCAADARLIQAAPDLLEALIAAVNCKMVPVTSATEGGAAKHSIQVCVADQIRAAIAKATGEQA